MKKLYKTVVLALMLVILSSCIGTGNKANTLKAKEWVHAIGVTYERNAVYDDNVPSWGIGSGSIASCNLEDTYMIIIMKGNERFGLEVSYRLSLAKVVITNFIFTYINNKEEIYFYLDIYDYGDKVAVTELTQSQLLKVLSSLSIKNWVSIMESFG